MDGQFVLDSRDGMGESYENDSVTDPTNWPTVTAIQRVERVPAEVRQETAVSEVQTVLSHAEKAIRAAGVKPWCAKPVPAIMTVTEPVVGPLPRLNADNAGLSYENMLVVVPTRTPTVTEMLWVDAAPAVTRHLMDDSLSQAVASAEVPPIRVFKLQSDKPKDVPTTLTTACAGVLLNHLAVTLLYHLAVGISYENISVPVPTWIPDVTIRRMVLEVPETILQ
jgi:hypothetical protein